MSLVTQYYTIHYDTTHYDTIQHDTIHYNTIHYHCDTIHYNTIQQERALLALTHHFRGARMADVAAHLLLDLGYVCALISLSHGRYLLDQLQVCVHACVCVRVCVC